MPHRGPDTTPVSTIVKYGDFAFHEHGIPTPFVTMEQQMLNEHSGRWGRIDNITINGVISGDAFSELSGAQTGVINAFSSDFKSLSIEQDGVYIVTKEFVKVNSISFEDSNYKGVLDFSIELECYNELMHNEFFGITDPENKTSIKISPWDKKRKISVKDPKTKKYESKFIEVPAFGLAIIRNGNQVYRIPLDPGETVMIKNFLNLALNKIYEARLKKQQEYQAKKRAEQQK